MTQVSRREFVMGAATGAAFARFGLYPDSVRAAGAITAQEIVDRIKKNVGVEWQSETVDTFKAGNAATQVTGVVATAMATMDVLRRAVKAGANLVITCEPTFYAKADSPTPPPRRGGSAGPVPDPIFTAKSEFIQNNDLVIWRFSDHWRLRKPDPLDEGLSDLLGWSRFITADDPTRFSIPGATLSALASDLKKKLNARGGIRVIGDPQLKVQRIGLLPGTTPIQASLTMLPAVDVIVAGEVREWESVEYARDTVTAAHKKGLVLLGRVLSEEPGMNVCAQWLRRIVPEVRTTWLRVGDPYWRPV